jgi:tellurite methyltransferase
MSHPDAERWNARYQIEGPAKLKRPAPRLLRQIAYLLPSSGLALDAACGVGTHAMFLAEHGLQVIGMDISLTALHMALQVARQRQLPFSGVVWDLAYPWLPPAHFEVIINFRFLERVTFPVFKEALKPGGLLIFETFVSQGDEGQHPSYYLNPGELLETFNSYEILQHGLQPAKERVMEYLVARKPKESPPGNSEGLSSEQIPRSELAA